MLQDNKDNNDNILPFSRNGKGTNARKIKPPPMFNIPPVTLGLTILFLAIHLAVFAGGYVSGSWEDKIFTLFGFTPQTLLELAPLAPLTLITYALLHASWLHVGMNVVMLVAFGAGVEKGFGMKSYLLIFWGSCVIAALVHFAIDPYSTIPIVGASGGISGLFGAALLLLREQGAPMRLLPLILLWVGISALFGFMGGPDGSSIAWVAHIGGFLGGLAITQYLRR